MPSVLELCSPAQGFLRPLEQVPDPVFSEHMLGNGFAIEPAEGILYAPFAGTVSNINKNAHALVLTQNGFEILLHIGCCVRQIPARTWIAPARQAPGILRRYRAAIHK